MAARELEILLVGDGDVAPLASGGSSSLEDLAQLRAAPGVQVRVRHRPLARLEDLDPVLEDLDPAPSVAVLSVAPALDAPAPASALGAWFTERMGDATSRLQHLGCHVLVLNASTFDPDDRIHCYKGIGETPALRLHRLNAALMGLSIRFGISIVDVDRIVAELGAESAVEGLLKYRSTAIEAVRAEVVRILDEYRLLGPGAVAPQIGMEA